MGYPVQGNANIAPRPAPLVAKKPLPPHDAARRLQIGAAGVVVVLLLVGMAGIASDNVRENANGASVPSKESGAMASGNSSPLEELGVQAVAKDSSVSNGLAEDAPLQMNAAATAPRQSVPDLEPDPELQRARQQKN